LLQPDQVALSVGVDSTLISTIHQSKAPNPCIAHVLPSPLSRDSARFARLWAQGASATNAGIWPQLMGGVARVRKQCGQVGWLYVADTHSHFEWKRAFVASGSACSIMNSRPCSVSRLWRNSCQLRRSRVWFDWLRALRRTTPRWTLL